jgi:conjugal transfer pilus assembly protein TraE
MILENLIKDVEARAGVTKAFQFILGASLLTNVFMAGAYATMDRTVRTVLVPPEIKQSFWVDGRNISPEYLEQMGTWVISQFATISPSTIDFQNNSLLKYVHPSVHGDLAIRFKMGANRLKAENLSKIFLPREVRISEKGQSVALIGMQTIWIGDKRVSEAMKAYVVTFEYDGSRVTIKELREASIQKPFDAPVQTAGAEMAMESQQVALPQQATPIAGDPVIQNTTSISTTGLPPAPLPPSSPAAQEALQAGALPTPTVAPR